MTTTIGRAELTTEHAASSHGQPVLVLDGAAYGPEDMIDQHMAGSVMVCSDAVTMHPDRLTAQDVDALCAWLGQSAQHGPRWIKAVRACWTDRNCAPEL
jgi:hypothetical protein